MTVTPTPVTISFLGGQTLTAQAYDVNNSILPNVRINWTTSNASIVAVSSVGSTSAGVTGVNLGTAAITAVPTDGPISSASVTVNAGPYLAYNTFTTMGSLSGRIPDVSVMGSAWTVVGNGGAPVNDGTRAYFYTCCGQTIATMDTGGSDVKLSVDWSAPSSTTVVGGLVFRMSDSSRYLSAIYNTDTLYLYKTSPETGTVELARNTIVGSAVGSTQQLEVRATAFDIQMRVNGVLRIQVSEGFNATATRHGLFFTTQYTWYDNFSVTGTLPPVISQVVVSPATSEC